jgi:protein-S-isoprenylcysteine O-methyltransferase Ste14
MLTTILAYLLFVLFLLAEGRTRVGAEAKSLEKGASDRGSTSLVGIAFFICWLALLAAPVLNYVQLGAITPVGLVGWLGLVVACLGFALRFWAVRTLGRFYTRTLRLSANQPIVREGPYRLIRHPGYLGDILLFLGAALAATNWIAFALVLIVIGTAYYYRIRAEETMLLGAGNADYNIYRAHTWKLIPFIY